MLKFNINKRYPFRKKYFKDYMFKGFTMIELLMVMAMIGALAAVVLYRYPASQRRAYDTRRKSDIKQYQTAVELYANKNNGNYPVYSGILSASAFCQTTLGLDACPQDPDTTPAYQIRSIATEYVVWATMEQRNDLNQVVYFILCSNGESSDSAIAAPTSSTCPL